MLFIQVSHGKTEQSLNQALLKNEYSSEQFERIKTMLIQYTVKNENLYNNISNGTSVTYKMRVQIKTSMWTRIAETKNEQIRAFLEEKHQNKALTSSDKWIIQNKFHWF